MKNCKQRTKKVLILLLAGSMLLSLLSLTGCEESLAFTETTYWYEAEEIDHEVEPLRDDQEDNTEVDPNAASLDEDDDSDRDQEEDPSESLHDDEEDSGDSADASYMRNQSETGETEVASADADTSDDTTGTAVEGTSNDSGYAAVGSDSSSSSSGAGVSSDGGNAVLGGSEGDSGLSVDPGINEEDDDEDSDLNAGTNDDDDETNTDEEGGGSTDADPIEASVTVIATGEAAILTQMLDADALYATDQATYDAMAAYFPADELAGVEILWSGDSTGSVDTEKLDTLIAAGDTPTACLMDSTALNADDVPALSDRGISCTALTFDSYDSILSAVSTAASVIGTDEAAQMKAEYSSFCSEIEEMVGEYESEKYTVFICEWDSNAQISITTVRTGTWKSRKGLAVTSKLSDSPVDEMWKLAGVYNTFSDKGIRRSEGSDGSTSSVDATSTYDEYLYVNQIMLASSGLSMKNCKYDIDGRITINHTVTLYKLGTDDYPAIVTASQSIRDSWEEDKNYSNDTQDGGMYTPYIEDYVGIITDMRKLYLQYGDVSHLTMVNKGIDDGNFCYIMEDYEEYVNPDGLGDWMDGSAESILEAPWIAWKIQGTCTEEQVRAEIKEFYETFYRCSLTDAQVDAILAGNES